MTMKRHLVLIASAIGAMSATAGVFAAQSAQSLTGVAGGLWELSGIPGAKAAVRQCVADPVELAMVEHKNVKCTPAILNVSGSSVKLSYQCVGGGFGQATIKTITPRSLRLDVQGIADGAPYGYVLQAHRVGDCPTKAERGGH